jgi:hypothetical protein
MVGHREACAATTTADPLDQWRHGLAALQRAESDDPDRREATIVCTAALDVLTDTPGLPDPHFGDALNPPPAPDPSSQRHSGSTPSTSTRPTSARNGSAPAGR